MNFRTQTGPLRKDRHREERAGLMHQKEDHSAASVGPADLLTPQDMVDLMQRARLAY